MVMVVQRVATKEFIMAERFVTLPDKYCKEIGAMCHFQLWGSKLVIEVDYDSPQFALWKYLSLTMKDQRAALKQSRVLLEEMGLTNT